MLRLAAAGFATAYGSGLGAIAAARAARHLPFGSDKGFIGADFRPQRRAFAGNAGPGADPGARLAGLVASAVADLGVVWQAPGPDASQMIPGVSARGWPEPGLVLLMPGAETGFVDAKGAAAQIGQGLQGGGWIGDAAPHAALAGGAAGIAAALERAAALVGAGHAALLVVADTHACRVRLCAALDGGRLFSKATPYGFIPGEAAAALLFLPEPGPCAARLWWASAIEPVPEGMAGDAAFEGMSEAARLALALAAADGAPPPLRLLSDWNNSRYKATELSYAALRAGAGLPPPGLPTPEYPALSHGHTGTGWFAVALAEALLGDRPALTLCGNDADGGRAAVMIV